MKPPTLPSIPVNRNGSTLETPPVVPTAPLPNVYRTDGPDGVTTLTFDHPDSSANVFDLDTLRELETMIREIHADPGVRGLVFASAKPAVFLAGADLKELSACSPSALAGVIDLGQSIFSAIASLEIPTVAVIHGACLGGGVELALACDWRIASDDRSTKIGLPETQLGILPAWGGSTRLPRLLGLRKALELIVTGKQLDGQRARHCGLVDDVAPRERIGELTLRFLGKGKRRPAHHLAGTMEEAYGERLGAPPILRRLTSAGHLGKKSGRGFYAYGARGAVPELTSKRQHLVRPEIARRLSLLMVEEAQRCLAEGVVATPEDIDFAMVFGTGFAPFRGGPVQYGRTLGHVRKLPETPAEAEVIPATVIDTSKMSAEQRAALELTESSRTEAGKRHSLAASFFMGTADVRRILPFPEQSSEGRAQGDAFVLKLRRFLEESVDPDAIDREGEIPEAVLNSLAEMGAFGIKIPTRYGGLGLSQTNYSRAAMCLGGVCGNLTALLSAHQSIGVPQPLLMFGTEAQKERYLPRVARGEISAFALTEPEVGSDPAKMRTVARPVDDGKFFEISGEKLWCTNGTKAGLLVVMAKVVDDPETALKPESARTITAFIVEANAPGVSVVTRCHFMGLRALYNGVMRFDQVRVPRENIILGEGRGLKVALSTLNTGRLTLPAACAGMAQECLRISLDWAGHRVQWGAPVGRHDAIAQKLAKMAADTRAIEAMVYYTSSLVDRDKKADIRIEAAMAKLWGTERAWEIVNETMQIRGGRGYETADSLAARGEDAVPVERFLRDCRINTIFEGSSEIMRLFIAREALDPHLRMGGPVLNSTLPLAKRFAALVRSGCFYSFWYPRLWLPDLRTLPGKLHPSLRNDLRQVRRLSRKLLRRFFHAILLCGPKLEKKQILLGRFVDVGAELFAMTALISRTQLLQDRGEADDVALTQYFCRTSRQRIATLLKGARRGGNADTEGYRLAKAMLVKPEQAS